DERLEDVHREGIVRPEIMIMRVDRARLLRQADAKLFGRSAAGEEHSRRDDRPHQMTAAEIHRLLSPQSSCASIGDCLVWFVLVGPACRIPASRTLIIHRDRKSTRLNSS